MLKNTFSAVLPAEDLIEIDAAITTLENKFPFLVGLEAEYRRTLNGMGPQTASFAGQALQAALMHPGLIPADLNVPVIRADKELRELMLPRYERIRALKTKMDHTLLLVGSEYYGGALAIYKALKAFGRAAGLEDLLSDLKRRFSRARRELTAPTPEDPVI